METGNSQLEELLFRYRFYLIAAFIGILSILFGIVLTTKQLPNFSGEKVEILSAQDEADGRYQIVEIAGAVEKPGVYGLQADSRIEDLLVMAGGLSATADREWVSRTLNRAAKLADGQKVYIPEKTQISNVKAQNQNLNINVASQSQLKDLPGIGQATAEKIIEQRPYSAVEELLTRKIVKKNQYEQIKDRVSVY